MQGRQYYKTCQIAEGKFRGKSSQIWLTAEMTTAVAKMKPRPKRSRRTPRWNAVFAFRVSLEPLEECDPRGDRSVPP